MKTYRLIVAVAAGSLLLGSCVSQRVGPASPAVPAAPAVEMRNQGYSLLYSLMDDESDADKIFFIKHVDPSVSAAIKEVSAFAKETRDRLDALAKRDPTLKFDQPGLPKIEVESRNSEKKAETRALLSASGADFARRFVFLQTQAMAYATQLATAMELHESDETAKKLLTDVKARSAAYQDRLLKLLDVKG